MKTLNIIIHDILYFSTSKYALFHADIPENKRFTAAHAAVKRFLPGTKRISL